ncbi:hypothetical protein ACWKT5_32820 [Streptomyces avermitilis]
MKVHARNEVEAIAYMVLKRLDPDVRMGGYISGHLGPDQQVPETVALILTFKAADWIIDMARSTSLPPNSRSPRSDQGRRPSTTTPEDGRSMS